MYSQRQRSPIAILLMLPLLLIWSHQSIAEALTVVVQEPFVDMRSGPASAYPVFHVAEHGEQISVLKSRTQWYKVRTTKGIEGWISADDLNLTAHLNGEPVRVSNGSFADYQLREWELGFGVGLLDDVTAMSASVGWVMTENFTAEVSYAQALGDFAENKYWSIRLMHYTFPEWRISPYLALGTGQLSTTPRSNLVASGDESRRSDIMEVGAGVRYYLTRNMVVRLEYKSLLALTQRDEQEELTEWKLGVSVFF
ncbi:SH3 domain-containing protein [Alteromonas facilis]|uniref:SH3 domain-containing protein n=1 Tax=Alteromonas facilis TaxID=2048004 RepID=UPI000C28AFD1|nr:SH3 domain-containing protein [Alteromonas facilis]